MKLHLTLIPLIGAALAKGCARSGAEMSAIAATKAASRAAIYATRDYNYDNYEASTNDNSLSSYSYISANSGNILDIEDFTQKKEAGNNQVKSKETAHQLMTDAGNFLDGYNLVQDEAIYLYESQIFNFDETNALWKERTSALNKLLFKVADSELEKNYVEQIIKQLEIIQNKVFKKAMKSAEEKLKANTKNNENFEESTSTIPEAHEKSKSDSLNINLN